jgi:hypothetical protein
LSNRVFMVLLPFGGHIVSLKTGEAFDHGW